MPADLTPTDVSATERAFRFRRTVRVGDLLFLSGYCSSDADGAVLHEGDVDAQFRHVYELMRQALSRHGALPGDIVDETIYTTDIAAAAAAGPSARDAFYGDQWQGACTMVEVRRLGRPGFLIEIRAQAVVGRVGTQPDRPAARPAPTGR